MLTKDLQPSPAKQISRNKLNCWKMMKSSWVFQLMSIATPFLLKIMHHQILRYQDNLNLHTEDRKFAFKPKIYKLPIQLTLLKPLHHFLIQSNLVQIQLEILCREPLRIISLKFRRKELASQSLKRSMRGLNRS